MIKELFGLLLIILLFVAMGFLIYYAHLEVKMIEEIAEETKANNGSCYFEKGFIVCSYTKLKNSTTSIIHDDEKK